MDTPFEEVLEKAKAGDPKAQTEVSTAVSGGRRRPWPQNSRPGQELRGVGTGAPEAGAVWLGNGCPRDCPTLCLAPFGCVSLFARSLLLPLGELALLACVLLTPGLRHHLLWDAFLASCLFLVPHPALSLHLRRGCHTLVSEERVP